MKIALLPMTIALLVAACGGATTPTAPASPAAATPTASPTEAPPTATAPGESLTPGSVNYRLINLYHDASGAPAPVDVYVRTQGLVRAASVVLGLAFGEMTDSFAPPEPGTVVVTLAGAGDATCVATCPHIIATSGTTFGEGTERTMILYDEGALELWNNPESASVGQSGNALAPADPSTALVLVSAVAVKGADFGLRLGFEGVAGCQVNQTAESILIGGNQIAVFSFDGGSAIAYLYDNRDAECSGDHVGGPIALSGSAGARTLLVLYGEPGSIGALTLEI